ncbi:MAG: hypothetical protein AAFN18_22805 [Cyanobacteria bacterium J06554_6]
MRFWITDGVVNLDDGERRFSCSVARFVELEPAFVYHPDTTEHWTPVLHYVVSDRGQRAAGLPSRAGYVAKIADYQAAEQTATESVAATAPDWTGFRQWRYADSDYLSLMQVQAGLMTALENAISQRDFVAAGSVWGRLIAGGYVPAALLAKLAQAAEDYRLPTEIVTALTEV